MNNQPPLRAAILVTLCLLASFELNADGNTDVAGSSPARTDAVTHLLMYHHYPEFQVIIEPGAGPTEHPIAFNSFTGAESHTLRGRPSIFQSDHQ